MGIQPSGETSEGDVEQDVVHLYRGRVRRDKRNAGGVISDDEG